MKRSRISALERRKSSTPHFHYQTFPTKPPTSRGRPPSQSPGPSRYYGGDSPSNMRGNDSHSEYSPLPKSQLIVLAIIALAEQTAFNSISPYLPEMASTFPEVDVQQVGLYVGLIASSFALAQFATNFLWGWLSDRIGRKPVILMSTLFTAACFIAFGFCRTLWQAILVQSLMGLVNGNQGVVSTCLGEITDRSNQSDAFTYLPVIYGIGAITGPAVGGLLVTYRDPFDSSKPNAYPYLIPNLVSAVVLMVELVVTMVFLEESLEQAKNLPPLGSRLSSLFTWLWQFTSSSRPSYLRIGKARHTVDGGLSGISENGEDDGSETASQRSMPTVLPKTSTRFNARKILDRDTILLLGTYLLFQLANISFNSLYPIFSSSPEPTGRNLSPEFIGLSLSFAGVLTILFQVGLFGKLREKIGNKITYRASLGGFVIAFLLMPWVGYKESAGLPGLGQGKVWLYAEIGFVLLVKTLAAVAGLTAALLLITNSAPNHSVLGALNGLAQTLSAAGRAIGPFLSGGLFSLAIQVRPKGEALAWGIFGGITFVGFLLSFGIRSDGLEAEGWDEEADGTSTMEAESGNVRNGDRARLLDNEESG